jgi:hypothetical protein
LSQNRSAEIPKEDGKKEKRAVELAKRENRWRELTGITLLQGISKAMSVRTQDDCHEK